jgi:hypothetical protein
MIPRTTLDLSLDDPASVSGYPPLDDLFSDTFDGNRLYDPGILDADWDDVRDAIEIEKDLISAADAGSTTADEFDAILDEDLEDWQAMALRGLDVGVAAAVLALSAAGCATSSSCRGHHAQHPSPFVVPEVVFWTNPERAGVIREVAAKVGCAFGVGDEGRASVWAPSVVEMAEFAGALLAERATLDALSPPGFRRPVDHPED